MKRRTDKPKPSDPPAKNVSCFVRFPPDVYEWLQSKANAKYRSVQQQVIEVVLAARETESQGEQAA